MTDILQLLDQVDAIAVAALAVSATLHALSRSWAPQRAGVLTWLAFLGSLRVTRVLEAPQPVPAEQLAE